MLFDLLRGRGDWNRYQQLSEQFTTSVLGSPHRNGTTRKRWRGCRPSCVPGRPATFSSPARSTAPDAREMDRVREAARSLASVHLDVSRVTALDEPGCTAFAELLRFLPANGNGVMFTGAELSRGDAARRHGRQCLGRRPTGRC